MEKVFNFLQFMDQAITEKFINFTASVFCSSPWPKFVLNNKLQNIFLLNKQSRKTKLRDEITHFGRIIPGKEHHPNFSENLHD